MKTTEEMTKSLNQMMALVKAFENAKSEQKAELYKDMFCEMETIITDMNCLCVSVGKPDKKDSATMCNVFTK